MLFGGYPYVPGFKGLLAKAGGFLTPIALLETWFSSRSCNAGCNNPKCQQPDEDDKRTELVRSFKGGIMRLPHSRSIPNLASAPGSCQNPGSLCILYRHLIISPKLTHDRETHNQVSGPTQGSSSRSQRGAPCTW